jgi:Man1-Src1p-C-terminal domain
MPEFNPVTHLKDGHPSIEDRAVDADETDINQDLVELHSDNDSVFELAASREMAEHVTHVQRHSASLNAMQVFARGVIWLFILFTGYSVLQYKLESSTIGFCDTGSDTNRALQELLTKRLAMDECIRDTTVHNSSEVEQGMISDSCPLKPLVPLPRPKSCTPCPEYASCGQFDVFCDSGYLIKPNILLSFIPVKSSASELSTKYASYLAELFFHTVSAATDGLPGFGSVGLPPRCVEDPQRRRNIGSLGKAIESSLAKERGRRVCLRNNVGDKNTQEDAMRWGVEVENLREVFRKKTTVRSFTFFSLTCIASYYQLSLPSYLCSMICLTRRFAS